MFCFFTSKQPPCGLARTNIPCSFPATGDGAVADRSAPCVRVAFTASSSTAPVSFRDDLPVLLFSSSRSVKQDSMGAAPRRRRVLHSEVFSGVEGAFIGNRSGDGIYLRLVQSAPPSLGLLLLHQRRRLPFAQGPTKEMPAGAARGQVSLSSSYLFEVPIVQLRNSRAYRITAALYPCLLPRRCAGPHGGIRH